MLSIALKLKHPVPSQKEWETGHTPQGRLQTMVAFSEASNPNEPARVDWINRTEMSEVFPGCPILQVAYEWEQLRNYRNHRRYSKQLHRLASIQAAGLANHLYFLLLSIPPSLPHTGVAMLRSEVVSSRVASIDTATHSQERPLSILKLLLNHTARRTEKRPPYTCTAPM